MGKKKGASRNNKRKRKHGQTDMNSPEKLPSPMNDKKKNKLRRNDTYKNNMKNNNKLGQNYNRNNKGKTNSRRNMFWIERCTTNKPPKNFHSDNIIKVLVSGVELSDNFTYVNDSKFTHNSEKKKSNSSIQKDIKKDDHINDNDNNKTTSRIRENDIVDDKGNEKGDEKIGDGPNGSSEKGEGGNEKELEETSEDVIGASPKEVISRQIEKNEKSKVFVHLIRCKSANTKRNPNHIDNYKVLPNGDCGDGIINPFPKDEVDDKYWAQRKRFFTKFDEGIQLDKESWYSVTPEAIATHVAKRMAKEIGRAQKSEHQIGGAVILDAFCGCGGNAIGFGNFESSEVELVICVDIDRSKLKMAANNASIYGIEKDKIIFIESDSTFILEKCYKDGVLVDFKEEDSQMKTVETEIVKGYRIGGPNLLPQRLDAVFMSPPWGGPNYMNVGKKGYLLQSITLPSWDKRTINGEDLLLMAKNACKQKVVIYFVPKTINGNEVGKSAFRSGYRDIEVEKNVLNGKLKTVTVYLKA